MLKLPLLFSVAHSISLDNKYFQEVPEDYALHVQRLYDDIHMGLVPDEDDIDPLYEGLAETDGDILMGEWYGQVEDDLQDILATVED